MEAALPTTLSMRFGLRTYELYDEDLLNPGDLIDKLVRSTDVCKAGAFVGRLKDAPSTHDITQNVEAIKKMVRSDEVFPQLLERMQLPGNNRAFLIHATGEGDNGRQRRHLKELRKTFRDKVLAANFDNLPGSKLESILETGIGPFIDAVLVMLTQDQPEPILYAQNIDVQPTLSTTSTVKLSAMNSHILKLAGGRHIGIVSPTVYIGSEGSTFNCHREDMAFEAVNRHIAGAPKIWFFIPPKFHHAFCLLLTKLGLREDERNCTSFLQHKFVWIDPRVVIENGIPVRMIVQRPGDVVFSLPYAIHWGVNLGMNLNEAVNVASKTWAGPGMLCHQRCQCESVAGLYYQFDIRRMLQDIGVSQEVIQNYMQGNLLDISNELRYAHPELHPEMGIPDQRATNVEHLLGPEADWDQIGKMIRPLLRRGPDGAFVGGFQMLELNSSEEEPEEESGDGKDNNQHETDYHEKEEDDDEDEGKEEEDDEDIEEGEEGGDDEEKDDEDEEDESVAQVKMGTYKCPECGKDTQRYGKRGMASLRHHITKEHLEKTTKLMKEVTKQYSKECRRYSSSALVCNRCGKSVRGTAINLIRHQGSRNCIAQEDDIPGPSTRKRLRNDSKK